MNSADEAPGDLKNALETIDLIYTGSMSNDQAHARELMDVLITEIERLRDALKAQTGD